MNKIEIESVCLKFGKRKVLNNISFEITPGKIIGIVGPNGSGKTSLLKIIAGILRPDSGTVKMTDFGDHFEPFIGPSCPNCQNG